MQEKDDQKQQENKDECITIESYVRENQDSNFKDNPTGSYYYSTSEKKPVIIGKKNNEANFVINMKAAVSPKHLQVSINELGSLDQTIQVIDIEKEQEVDCLFIRVRNLGMNSTCYKIEPEQNKVQYEKMSPNEIKIFRISQDNGVIFYLGSRKLVRVVIIKAKQDNIDYHKQEQDKQIYFENYVCDCGINFKRVKCYFCKKLFICEPCFIFKRKSVFVKNKCEATTQHSIQCQGAHSLDQLALKKFYEVTDDGKVQLQTIEQWIL